MTKYKLSFVLLFRQHQPDEVIVAKKRKGNDGQTARTKGKSQPNAKKGNEISFTE